jgi:predicted acyl esterase
MARGNRGKQPVTATWYRDALRAAVLRLAIGALVLAALPASASAAGPAVTPWPGGRWAPGAPKYGMKVESGIPVRMSDGATLHVTIGYPVDRKTGRRAAGKFPVLLTQNPYTGPTQQPFEYFVSRGYIMVVSEVRGSGESTGPGGAQVAGRTFSERDAQDGVELVHWVAKKVPGSNGKVGLTGCSYLGISQVFTAAAIGPKSPIKTIIPACGSNGYYVYFAGGMASQEGGLLSAGGSILGAKNAEANAAASKPLGEEIAAGTGRALDDDYWQERTTARVVGKIVENGIPALLWSGWSATESPGPLEEYAILQNTWAHRPAFAPMKPHQRTTGRYQIVVGPWSHGKGLDLGIQLEWYDTWLKGQDTGIADTTTPMHLYELQSDRWTNASTYPLVADATRYYLGANSTLTTDAPTATTGADSITWGQPTEPGTTRTYTSPPLADGTTIEGPISATIHASSSVTNLELIASLRDVAPDGSVQEVSFGALVGSLRKLDDAKTWRDAKGVVTNPVHPFAADDYLTPGTDTELDIKLNPTLWSVAPGHSLRLVLSTQTASDDCKLSLSALPQARPCYPSATQQATLAGGTYEIQRSSSAPSSINLPLAPQWALPTAPSSITATSSGQTEPIVWATKH